MNVRAAARILEKGVQDDLIHKTEETMEVVGGRSWMDHSAAWIPVKGPHYNTSLEEILTSMGENGEKEIEWDFHRGRQPARNIQSRELGTKDTPRIVWELRIRELEEEKGWTTAFTDGSGLDNMAAGSNCANPTKATHIDGELEGIALALEAHNDRNTGMLAILSDCRPATRVTDSGTEGPRSSIEASIQRALETRENRKQETYLAWVKGHKDIKGN